jgi:hypothetical protein
VDSWQSTERAARDWMRARGFADAALTRGGADEGVDIRSTAAVAQVKHTAAATSRPAVQQLYGCATAEQRIPLFFSSAGYTAGAVQWGERYDVALYTFDGSGWYPASTRARALVDSTQSAVASPPTKEARRQARLDGKHAKAIIRPLMAKMAAAGVNSLQWRALADELGAGERPQAATMAGSTLLVFTSRRIIHVTRSVTRVNTFSHPYGKVRLIKAKRSWTDTVKVTYACGDDKVEFSAASPPEHDLVAAALRRHLHWTG